MTMSAADVKKRQREESEKSNRGGKTPYLKIEDGQDIMIRIGPPWLKEGEVWKDRLLHGGFKNKVYCANNDIDKDSGKKRRCKVEEKLKELKDDRSAFSKKFWTIIHQRTEGLWNVLKVRRSEKDSHGRYIVEKYEDNAFKVLQLSPKWHLLLMDIFAEEDYRDGKAGILGVTHPKYGRLIKVKRRGKEMDTTYTFTAVDKATPIFEDEHKTKKILKTLVNLDKISRGSSDEELSAFIHRAKKEAKHLAEKEDKDKKSGSSSSSGSSSKSASASASASASKSKSKSASKSASSSSSRSKSASASGSASKDSMEEKYKEMKKKAKGGSHSGSKSKSKSSSASSNS
jgi:hypothetical protein